MRSRARMAMRALRRLQTDRGIVDKILKGKARVFAQELAKGGTVTFSRLRVSEELGPSRHCILHHPTRRLRNDPRRTEGVADLSRSRLTAYETTTTILFAFFVLYST